MEMANVLDPDSPGAASADQPLLSAAVLVSLLSMMMSFRLEAAPNHKTDAKLEEVRILITNGFSICQIICTSQFLSDTLSIQVQINSKRARERRIREARVVVVVVVMVVMILTSANRCLHVKIRRVASSLQITRWLGLSVAATHVG